MPTFLKVKLLRNCGQTMIARIIAPNRPYELLLIGYYLHELIIAEHHNNKPTCNITIIRKDLDNIILMSEGK